MKLYQIGDYVLNHKGEVWDMETNECIYASTYEDAKQFLDNITAE